MKNKLFIILIVIICAVLMIPAIGLADAGNFAGSTDFGGFDIDIGDSFDSGSGLGALGGLFLMGGSGGGSVAVIIIIILAVVIGGIAKSKNKKKQNNTRMYTPPMQQQNKFSIDELKKEDPNFSVAEFIQDVGNTYIRMQNAWQEKNWEPMRGVMSDALYTQFEQQLRPYIANKQTNHIDNIAVLSASISEYDKDEVNDILRVILTTRINDYVTDDVTGKVIRGSMTKELFMSYEWTYTRTRGVKTIEKDAMTDVECPNCGAPLRIKETAQCPYCDTVVTLSKHDWVLTAIRGLSQRSGN